MCNNKDEFKQEMQRFGIYVPEKDAAWETEESAFHSLLERHDTCDAVPCLCPEGRQKDEDYTEWEIVRLFSVFTSISFTLSIFCAATVRTYGQNNGY